MYLQFFFLNYNYFFCLWERLIYVENLRIDGSTKKREEKQFNWHLLCIAQFAVARTFENIDYDGVGAMLSVWNLPVQAPQYTLGRVKIKNGAESLEAGWTVSGQNILLVKKN